MAETKNVLVVGDWVIDEYWFLVRHRSDISSHTGVEHFRTSVKPHETIKDLCGAGHVARMLYDMSDSPIYNIYGIGNWNDIDTTYIKHLIHSRRTPECTAASASSSATQVFCSVEPQISLFTLQPDSQTIRVIRQYHQQHKGLEQVNRVDWESQQTQSTNNLSNKLGDIPLSDFSIDYVVVQDLAKGVVVPELIRAIRNACPNASWFIRSKEKNPTWVGVLEPEKILTNLIGPELAALQQPNSSWIQNGRISYKAMEYLEAQPGQNIFLLTDEREIIAYIKPTKICQILQSTVKPSVVLQLGWPSAVFSCLVHATIQNQGSEGLSKDVIAEAVRLAEDKGSIRIPESTGIAHATATPPTASSPVSWVEEKERWIQSQIETGIISSGDSSVFDLWRGTSLLPGYITCIREKQETIIDICKKIKAFRSRRFQNRPLSILITADPGSGKTFLARSLAKTYNFHFLSFDITQMIHREELLDLFDTVASVQAAGAENILVFVDEINAKLANEQVYSTFLTPLEEGQYKRNGRVNSLKPAVWVFASTEKPKAGEERSRTEKQSDFESRITEKYELDLTSIKALKRRTESEIMQEATLEQVYLGISLIKNNFPDVQSIEIDVLKYLEIFAHERLQHGISPSREIRKLASQLKNVQHGLITREKNCGDWAAIFWPKVNLSGLPVMVKINQ